MLRQISPIGTGRYGVLPRSRGIGAVLPLHALRLRIPTRGGKHSSFLRKESKDEKDNEVSLLAELRRPLNSSPFGL